MSTLTGLSPHKRTLTPSPRARSGDSGVRGLVRRFPTASFFALAFGLSWAAWAPYVLSVHGLGVLDLRFPEVLGTTQLLGGLPGAYLGPLAAAFVVTALVEGRAGLRAWAHRLTHWRVGWRRYAAVLVTVPAVVLLSTVALPGALAGAQPISPVVLAAYLPMLVLQILTTSLAEEPGWRDFALPRLQASFGPVLGTTVLGLLWGCWHLPLFLIAEWGGYPEQSWVLPVVFVAGCVPLSIIMTWAFNRSGQSVPLVMVLHASINSTYTLVWPVAFPHLDFHLDTALTMLLASTAVAAVLLLATRGRLGLPAPARGGHPVEAAPAS
ncbi:CPBP family intramembrane glutamic endopeptidase [Geodermatophilus sp. FMUSA9-8]|uniref:CPBP family intramembrane glutamic endopeptidase n=1 Tax=Geodermatophilus sp. FMUSA9-8 TaxID=3120155 RepID=UPI0030091C59